MRDDGNAAFALRRLQCSYALLHHSYQEPACDKGNFCILLL